MVPCVTYLILVNLKSDNPVKSTLVNFSSMLTGLSAPCLIDILGMWSGSMGIKLIPLCPSFVGHFPLSNECAFVKMESKLNSSFTKSLWKGINQVDPFLLLPFNLITIFDIRTMQSVSPTEHRSMSWAEKINFKLESGFLLFLVILGKLRCILC